MTRNQELSTFVVSQWNFRSKYLENEEILVKTVNYRCAFLYEQPGF